MVSAAPNQQRPNNDARGRESSPARGAPRLTRDLAAPRTAKALSLGTWFFPPPNIETARARPRSPEHLIPGGPQSRSSRCGSDPVRPESRQRTGSEGGVRRGLLEGTAATVMALHACPSVAAEELRRPSPPPVRTTAGHFTSAHTRSRPAGARDAGENWSAARLSRDAALLAARLGSLRPSLPCPPRAPPPACSRRVRPQWCLPSRSQS